MSTWDPERLAAVDADGEMTVAAHRPDGSTRTPRIVWHVVVDGLLFVRSVRGTDGAWYRGVQRTGAAVVEVGGERVEVTFTADGDHDDAVDHAYRDKYGDGSAGALHHECPGSRDDAARRSRLTTHRERERTNHAGRRTSPHPEGAPGALHRRGLGRPHRRPRDEGCHVLVSRVRFSPGARTAWHRHPRGQTLHVLAGVAWIQSRGGAKEEVYPGQTVWCPPDEEHWHGAAPDVLMEHLAMNDTGGDPSTTAVWGDHVTDEEYSA